MSTQDSLEGLLPHDSVEPIPSFLRMAFEEGVLTDRCESHNQRTSSPRRVISGRREETPMWMTNLPAELRPATGKFITELEHPSCSHGYFTTPADCIALTVEEADEPCGELTTNELLMKILRFRGKLFPVESSITTKYAKLASEETGVPLSEAENESLVLIYVLLRRIQICVEHVENQDLTPEAAFEQWKQLNHAMLRALMQAPWQLWFRYIFRTQLHFAREYIQNDVCRWEKHFLASPEPPWLFHFSQSDMLRRISTNSLGSLYEFAQRFLERVLVLPANLSVNSDHHTDRTESWLEYFIRHNATFGIVHAWATACHTNPYLRLQQPEKVHPSFCQMLHSHSHNNRIETDDKFKDSQYIQSLTSIGPRRVWDVCSNRVVPFEWFADPLCFQPHLEIRNRLWPVSHSWVAANDREILFSSVNNWQWPIPLPKGVSLEAVRDELLGMNCQYTWLDVLCLRQEYPGQEEAEALRLEEWKIDIPTIGFVYHAAECVITYFNGIGMPFKPLETISWQDDDRHWLNRVWTFQETKRPEDIIIGGLQKGMDNPLRRPRELIDPGFPMALRLADQLLGTGTLKRSLHNFEGQDLYTLVTKNAGEKLTGRLIDAVVLLRKRHATNPVDIIASLAYQHAESMLDDQSLMPVYLPHESVTEAWLRFVICTTKKDHVLALQYQLMRVFPFPSRKYWFPSWTQIEKYPDVGFFEPQEPDAAVDLHIYFDITHPGTRVFRHCRVKTTERSVNANVQLRTMWNKGIVPIWQRQDTESRSRETMRGTLNGSASILDRNSPARNPPKHSSIPTYHFERHGAIMEFDTATQPSVNIGICQYREAVVDGLNPPVPKFFPDIDENLEYTLVYIPFEMDKRPPLLTQSRSYEYSSILIVCREIEILEPTDPSVILRRITSFNCTEGDPFIKMEDVDPDTPWSQPDHTVAGVPGVSVVSGRRVRKVRIV